MAIDDLGYEVDWRLPDDKRTLVTRGPAPVPTHVEFRRAFLLANPHWGLPVETNSAAIVGDRGPGLASEAPLLHLDVLR